MRCSWYVSPSRASYSTRTACALIVIPRSRSRSIESSTCARIARGSTVFVISRMRSASVDFPWSMWAMIEKLRMCAWSAMRRVTGYGARRGVPRGRRVVERQPDQRVVHERPDRDREHRRAEPDGAAERPSDAQAVISIPARAAKTGTPRAASPGHEAVARARPPAGADVQAAGDREAEDRADEEHGLPDADRTPPGSRRCRDRARVRRSARWRRCRVPVAVPARDPTNTSTTDVAIVTCPIVRPVWIATPW